jgi:hypothetical protein
MLPESNLTRRRLGNHLANVGIAAAIASLCDNLSKGSGPEPSSRVDFLYCVIMYRTNDQHCACAKAMRAVTQAMTGRAEKFPNVHFRPLKCGSS